MSIQKSIMRQHERLRVPRGWEEQDKALIIQLNRLLDDIYARFETKYDTKDKADKSEAISDITRNGTTFTATRADGSTFTFTQQDSSYPTAITDITRNGTTFTATRANGTTFTFDQQDNSYPTAITNITRSGTTFTATRANGTTFTFTQQDNDHHAWDDITGKPSSFYTLPLAANGTRGGVQVGYTQSGKNYPVQLSGEKMYVNVPWTDTNTAFKYIISRGNVTAETGKNRPSVSGLSMTQAYNNGYPLTYGNVMTLNGSGCNQLLLGWSGTSGRRSTAYIRNKRDTSDANWSDWSEILDSDNYAGYAAKKTEAIKNITRSGTTFTATRTDGTTFTFTQQDNNTDTNTWRPVQNNLTSTSTTDCLSAYQGKVLNDKLGLSRIAHARANVTFHNGVGTYSNGEITADSQVMVLPQTGGVTSLILTATPAAGKVTLYAWMASTASTFSGTISCNFVIVR